MKLNSTSLLLLFISLSLSYQLQDSPQMAECQQGVNQVIYSLYQNLYQNVGNSNLLQIFLTAQTDLEQSLQKCVDDSCWSNGKEQCEKATLQPCIKNGSFWMAQCQPGYKPFGNSSSCIEVCPEGFKDSQESCIKPNSYSRGVGFSWIPGDYPFSLVESRFRCGKQHPDVGCELYGSVVYPKCKKNFANVSCCICEPKCPYGMIDELKSCRRQKYLSSEQFKSGICFEEDWIKNPILIQDDQCSTYPEYLMEQIKDIFDVIRKTQSPAGLKQVQLLNQLLKGYFMSCKPTQSLSIEFQ